MLMGYAKKLITKTNTWIFPRSPKHSTADDDAPKSKMLSKVMSINILKADPSKFGISSPVTDNRGNTRYFVTYNGKPAKFRTPKFTLKFNTKKFANNLALQWFLDERQLDVLTNIENTVSSLLFEHGIKGECKLVKRGSKYGEALRIKVPEFNDVITPKVINDDEVMSGLTSDELCRDLPHGTGVNVKFVMSFYQQGPNFYTPLTAKCIKITPGSYESDSDDTFSD